jgi:uncharacterized protein
VNAHPDRFQGFATLALPAPAAAARELERAVTKLGLQGALVFGRTGERNFDHPDNWPIFEAAASLRAPLYIHPQIPQSRVRAALYSGFDDAIDNAFASTGIGWHYESGVQFLRLALAGVFDHFPDLQVLLGHWGEVVLFYLDRADGLAMQAKLPQTFSEYVRRNAYITAGGVYSQRYLRWAVEVAGVERILFATDYPYRPGPDGGVEQFLQSAGLDRADQERIAAANWDALVANIPALTLYPTSSLRIAGSVDSRATAGGSVRRLLPCVAPFAKFPDNSRPGRTPIQLGAGKAGEPSP